MVYRSVFALGISSNFITPRTTDVRPNRFIAKEAISTQTSSIETYMLTEIEGISLWQEMFPRRIASSRLSKRHECDHGSIVTRAIGSLVVANFGLAPASAR
jgi:hypothetical protein